MHGRTSAALCIVAAAALLLGGCGRARQAAPGARAGQPTVKRDRGQTPTVRTDATGNSITITTTDAEGKPAELTGSNKVDMAKVGLEAYPGAAQEQGGVVEGPVMTIASVTLTTRDPYDRVAAFYKGHYPGAGAQSMTVEGRSTLSLQITDPADPSDQKMVVVTQEKGRATILLQRQSRKPAAGANR